MQRPIFHLAFPIKDVGETVHFFRECLGFAVDLVEDHRCIVNFGGHQIVAHVSPQDTPVQVKMYPRHFGIIFDEERDYEGLLARAKKNKANFFQEGFTRFAGTPREHKTFFLADPSNNLLEFKWYRNADLIFKPA